MYKNGVCRGYGRANAPGDVGTITGNGSLPVIGIGVVVLLAASVGSMFCKVSQRKSGKRDKAGKRWVTVQ